MQAAEKMDSPALTLVPRGEMGATAGFLVPSTLPLTSTQNISSNKLDGEMLRSHSTLVSLHNATPHRTMQDKEKNDKQTMFSA